MPGWNFRNKLRQHLCFGERRQIIGMILLKVKWDLASVLVAEHHGHTTVLALRMFVATTPKCCHPADYPVPPPRG